jgi:hypothetical protein
MSDEADIFQKRKREGGLFRTILNASPKSTPDTSKAWRKTAEGFMNS